MNSKVSTDLGTSLPLRRGSVGTGVTDLQRRLSALGFSPSDPLGGFGASTEAVLRIFQEQRGLNADGICGKHTWAAVVEAGYQLGDRMLYRSTPMLRGDDVAELQRRLSALGFDSGMIDGIYGDETDAALVDFQRNAGLTVDRICGKRTVDELLRIEPMGAGSDLVSPLRERLRVAPGLSGLDSRRIGVGEQGGFATGTSSVSRALRGSGSIVTTYHHSDASRNAADANAAGVECFVNLVLVPDEKQCSTIFYRGFRYESPASRRLAELVQAELPTALDLIDGGSCGMALPILRETRMPAIEIRLGAPLMVVQRIGNLAEVVARSLTSWFTNDLS